MAKAKKLPSGSWRVRVSVGKDANGKYIYRSFTAETKKEAEYMAAEYLHETKAESNPKQMTLGAAYDAYIASKENLLSPSTINEYKRQRKKCLQTLMSKRIGDITQSDIQAAINMEAISRSPKTVRNIHGLLSAVLALYRPSMSLHTTLPMRRKTSLYVPTEADIEQLLKSISGTELEKAVLLAAFGSLRRSEISPLLHSDLQGNVLSINKAMVINSEREYVVKTTKTTSSTRSITLPRYVAEKLTASGSEHLVDLTPSQITHQFARALKKHVIPHFRFHDLRHYQASILHAMGVPDKYIMERGGWKTDSTLKNIYQHAMSDKRKEVEENICSYFDDLCHKL